MRIRRIIHLAVIGASVSIGAAWWVSAHWDVTWCNRKAAKPTMLSLRRGRLEIESLSPGSVAPYGRTLTIFTIMPPRKGERRWDWWFSFHSGPNWWRLTAPLWIPLTAVALPSLRFAAQDLARWRRRACMECGYALVGLPDEGGIVRCPECGAKSRRACAQQ